jgi:GrpB-like predicted nucleotidyltransferase (UPF0157 family)
LRFAQESQRLRTALGPLCVTIEHIGSTAVPNLVAKPLIDMMGAVPSVNVLDAAIHRVVTLGYETVPMLDAVLVDSRFALRRGADGRRLFHFHLYLCGSEDWARHLRWRDRLCQSPALAQAYGALKQELALRYHHDRQGYLDEKHTFIERFEPDSESARQVRTRLKQAQAARFTHQEEHR